MSIYKSILESWDFKSLMNTEKSPVLLNVDSKPFTCHNSSDSAKRTVSYYISKFLINTNMNVLTSIFR